MLRKALDFIKRIYIIIFVILAVSLFFWFYNTYLIDRSLANLRFILAKVTVMKNNIEEARKIAMILEAMLTKEIAAQGESKVKPVDLAAAETVLAQTRQTPKLEKETQQLRDALRYASTGQEPAERETVMLEMVSDILNRPQSLSQLEDARFALKEIIDKKDQERLALLRFIDRVAGAVSGISKAELEKQANALKRRLSDIKEKDKLQEAFYGLGIILTQLGQIKNANAFYVRAIALQPDDHVAEKAKFNLALNEKTVGNLEKALQEFLALTETTSNRELKVFIQLQIADVLRKQAKFDEAISHLKKIVQEQPTADLAQLSNYIVSQIYLYNLDDTQKAKEELQKTKEMNEASSLSRYIDKQANQSIIERCLVMGFNFLKQAYFMSMPEKYSAALKNFDSALEIDPKDGFAYAGKSLVFLWLGEREKALEFSRRAVRLLPDNEITGVNLAYVYIELKMIDEAISELKRLIAVKPKTWQAHYNLAFAYIIKNNFSGAAKAFAEAEKINPGYPRILNNYGWCLWKLGRYAEAIKIFERAIFLEPQYNDALFNLGLIYKASGKYEEARSRLNKLSIINPAYPDLGYYLSDVNKVLRSRSSSHESN